MKLPGTSVLAVFAALFWVGVVGAQQGSPPSQALTFEVASIKHDTSNANMVRMGGPDPSRFVASNVTAKMLVGYAYNLKNFQISGGPAWADSERFDLDAKVEDVLAEQISKLPRSQQDEQMRSRMQNLLTDRFHLQVSRSSKVMSALALVVAKGGPKLTEVPPPDPSATPAAPPSRGDGRGPAPVPPGMARMSVGPGGSASIAMKAVPIERLVNLLSQQLGQQVVDQTGLHGTYDIDLEFTSDSGLGGGPLREGAGPVVADSSGTSIYTALEEQLGLKLATTKAPVDTLTVEHMEEPSEN